MLHCALMKMQRPKGTHDRLPEEQALWKRVYQTVETVLSKAGVQEIDVPIFEASEVFQKSVGVSADLVVKKEMFQFEDGKGRSMTLRPEFTAGVMRAFIQNGMHMRPLPVKLWSMGPVFRAENVQAGRYRQFHQVNSEWLGLDSPLIDAEAIALLYEILGRLGVKNMVVKLGSVGDPQDRVAYNEYLRAQLEPQQASLSPDSQTRLRLNPMRILDSKHAGDQALIAKLKRPLDMVNPEARAHFDSVLSYLNAWHIPYEIDDSIVRGLDYYRRTAFEIHHQAIGAQSALCGGGRYDGLLETMGGPKLPGIGWAFGVERVLLAVADNSNKTPPSPLLYIVALDDEAVGEAATLARTLRNYCHVEHGYGKRKVGKGLQDGDSRGAVFAALRGERERRGGIYQIKHLASGEQYEVAEAELEAFLRQQGDRHAST